LLKITEMCRYPFEYGERCFSTTLDMTVFFAFFASCRPKRSDVETSPEIFTKIAQKTEFF